ncbi:MAG: MFS transporter [Phycisphaerales bacterium]|nr:MFS transporter [Phycisphaerales bacterium]
MSTRLSTFSSGVVKDEASHTLRHTVLMATLTFIAMVPVTMLVAPLKELISLRYGASAFATHSFMSVNMIGAIIFAPLMFLWVDIRNHRKRVAVFALAADAVLLSLMALMPNLALILIVRFFEGAAHILALSTLMAMASAWAGEGRRGRVMGLVGTAMMFGTACGTRIGGLIWEHIVVPEWTFHIAGMIAAVAALCTQLFAAEPAAQGEARHRSRDVLQTLRQTPNLLIAFFYAFIDRLCVGVLITTFCLFLADVHGLDPSARSRLLLMFLLPFASLVYPAGRLVDRLGRVWPIVLGSLGFGIIFSFYGVLSLSGLYWIMILSGVLSASMFAANLTLCTDLTPVSQRGAAFTGFNMAGSLGFLLGPLFAGGLFATLSNHMVTLAAYQWTFLVAGGAEILCAAVTLPMLLRLKRSGSVA